MKKQKTVGEWTLWILEYARDVLFEGAKLLFVLLQRCIGGADSPLDSDTSSGYWSRERQRERNGYYKD